MEHKLKADGAAFDTEGNRVQEGTGGAGRALCSCGWMSEELTSGGQRRGAHKTHKANPGPSDLDTQEATTMEAKADEIVTSLERNDVVDVELAEGEFTWNPASTNGKIWGPATVHFAKHPDGGITATVEAPGEDAQEETDDNSIADDLAAFEADLAAEEQGEEAEQAFTSTLVYTGGYSPVLSRYADALNDDAEVTVKRSKAPKGHEVAISGPQDKVTALVARTEELEGQAMDALHEWQASDPERKGQTNNVRFAGSKRFLEAKLAAEVSA